MRAHDELERLTAAGRPLLADAESLVDAGEEDRILDRIVATPRPVRRRAIPRLRIALVLVGAATCAATIAVVSTGAFTSSTRATTQTGGHHQVVLSGSRIKLADFRFKTPAGFVASDTACTPPASDGQPQTVLSRFAAAASADGGCVEAFLIAPGTGTASPATLAGAEPVTVGSYQAYFVPQGQSVGTLYIEFPIATGPHYLVLFGQGLTEDQLIAVAESGLPSGSDSSNGVVRTLTVDEGAH